MRGHRVSGSPDYRLDETWLRQIGELMYARGADSILAHTQGQGLRSWPAGIGAALAGLHIPTLVLHGQADQLMRPEGGCAIAAAIPDATLILLPDMGHDLPQALWPTIIDHVRSIANRSGSSTS